MNDHEGEIADLMKALRDEHEKMSDAERVALKAAQAKLAADLDDDLEQLEREGKQGGPEWKVLTNLREAQAIADKILATAGARKRPN